MQHEKPWWFRLAERLVPERCREIPEALHPERFVLRQVALVRRRLYLQQISGSEDLEWAHHHEGPALCLGLWGSYWEKRLIGTWRKRKAPYLLYMSRDIFHLVAWPSPGHTSLFLLIRRERDRHYAPVDLRHWKDHVLQQVRRI